MWHVRLNCLLLLFSLYSSMYCVTALEEWPLNASTPPTKKKEEQTKQQKREKKTQPIIHESKRGLPEYRLRYFGKLTSAHITYIDV